MFLFNWIYNIFDLNWLYSIFQFSEPSTVLFLGVQNSGKTTLFKVLKTGKIGSFAPTMYPNSEELTIGK